MVKFQALGALVSASLVLGATPVSAATVDVVVKGCNNCQVTWISGESERGWPNQKPVSAAGGSATLQIPDKVTAIALGVLYGKRGFSGLSALDVVAFQYRGFIPGQSVSDDQSRSSRRARICHQVRDAETLRVRVAKVPITQAARDRSVIPIPHAQKFTLRAWASPTLSTTDKWTTAYRGEVGVQNTICGADWPWNR